MRSWALGAALLAACGDDIVIPAAPPLQHSDTLFIVAHPDDDLIFMQPDLLRALSAGSVTTIYATTAGQNGLDDHRFDATLVAYGGASPWDCGSLDLGVGTVEHCRLRDRPVSLVNFALADGGIPGDGDSLLHLVDGTILEIPGHGPTFRSIPIEGVIEMFSAVIAATAPTEVHTLELAGTHGRDHSSHMFVASFGLWAGAQLGLAAPTTWHRGYNVVAEAPTLTGDDFALAEGMLGVFEECADGHGRCGAPSTTVSPQHESWLARQYSSTRVLTASGRLALGDLCLNEHLALSDCANAATWQLTAAGLLQLGDRCLASVTDGTIALATCATDPAQYWVLDSEGFVWNGVVPAAAGDMSYDHVRCLGDSGAPTCGLDLQPRWQFLSPELWRLQRARAEAMGGRATEALVDRGVVMHRVAAYPALDVNRKHRLR